MMVSPDSTVLLISMPFASAWRPSIGLSLLQAGLTQRQISAKTIYFTLDFAERIGTLYDAIADGKPAVYDLLGEWLFSSALFPQSLAQVNQYVEAVLQGGSSAHQAASSDWQKPLDRSKIQAILTVRDQIEPFLEDCLNTVLQAQPRIVAFTSVFQQHLAALALAQRIKRVSPDIFIVMGGANCEGVMGAEVIRQFPFVDATIAGEGDLVFPELVQRVLRNDAIDSLQGVFTSANIDRAFQLSQFQNAVAVQNLDSLPYPNYEDYFEQLQRSELRDRQVQLLFETSRGCWWGEKHHCTFCGLNGESLAYRSKSAGRALNELLALRDRYPNSPIWVVDNILDMKYFKEFVPQLAAHQLDLSLYYEVKANLRKEQIQLLYDAGIIAIQPGIESLSTSVLQLMRKGIKGIQNIQLLKWCKELNVHADWNFLWGFPGESPEEYQRLTELIPLITHLQPPQAASMIRIDRFSPNFEESEQRGFTHVQPYPSYSFVYPFDKAAIANLAYYFTFQYAKPQEVSRYTQNLKKQIDNWQSIHSESGLFLIDKDERSFLLDLRPIAAQKAVPLNGLDLTLYRFCDRIQTLHQLQQRLKQELEKELSAQDLETLLQRFVNRGLMICEGDSYLSLAIPFSEKTKLNEGLLSKL